VRVDGTNATLWATDYGKSRIPVRNAGDDPTPGVTTYFGAEGDTRFTACWHAPHSRASGDDPMIPLRHPEAHADSSWHATHSFDYLIVVHGRIYLQVDEGETLLGPGDVVVQGGASHAWDNRFDEPCLMYCVIVGATEREA
jgi:mannose-6-phosphate isomerase-like protein (cupin superfamily)